VWVCSLRTQQRTDLVSVLCLPLATVFGGWWFL
jgi:hypothetical protein